MNYEKDYRDKILQPDNEEKLEELRQQIIKKIYRVGYTVTLEKVITMLDEWLKWQNKRNYKYRYYFGESPMVILPFITEKLSKCDEDYINVIYSLTEYHLESLWRGKTNHYTILPTLKHTIVTED